MSCSGKGFRRVQCMVKALYREGIFEKIMADIHPSYHCDTFSRTTVRDVPRSSSADFEILHVGYDMGEYGHYCGAVKSGDTVHFFDSMGRSEFTRRFVQYLRARYGKSVKHIVQDYADIQFQEPDCPYRLRRVGPSKHQYCYIEAFVYLSHKVLGTSMGPLDRKARLAFIRKRVSEYINKYVR